MSAPSESSTKWLSTMRRSPSTMTTSTNLTFASMQQLWKITWLPLSQRWTRKNFKALYSRSWTRWVMVQVSRDFPKIDLQENVRRSPLHRDRASQSEHLQNEMAKQWLCFTVGQMCILKESWDCQLGGGNTLVIWRKAKGKKLKPKKFYNLKDKNRSFDEEKMLWKKCVSCVLMAIENEPKPCGV